MGYGSPGATETPTMSPAPDERRPGGRWRRSWIKVAALIAAVALIVGAVLLMLGRSDDGAAAASRRPSASPETPSAEALPLSSPESLKARGRPFQVGLAWSSPSTSSNVTGYLILRDGAEIGLVNPPSTRFTDDGVVPGRDYTYEVRAQGDDDRQSEGISIDVSTPLPPMAEARVEGTFDVTSRFTSKVGYGEYSAPAFGWRFTPKCRSGPCDLRLEDIHRNEMRLSFTRTKGMYKAAFTSKFEIQCGGTPVTSTGTIVLRISKARVIDDEWRATRLTGTFTHEEAPQLGCRYSRAMLSVNAKLFR